MLNDTNGMYMSASQTLRLSSRIILLAFLTASHLWADEQAWFMAVIDSAERSRAATTSLDQQRLAPGSQRVAWSAAAGGPWSFVPETGYVFAKPAATIKVGSIDPGKSRLSWELSTGPLLRANRATLEYPLTVDAGFLAAGELDLRLTSTVSGNPSEKLRALELAGRSHENSANALELVVQAAGLAARSAAAATEADFLAARTAYLEREARRVEMELESGRVSRVTFMEARDAWTRSRNAADDARYEADYLGRTARMGLADPVLADRIAFAAEDLYQLGLALYPRLPRLQPGVRQAALAAAAWDLRRIELESAAIQNAPRLFLGLELLALPSADGSSIQPSLSGTLGLSAVLNSSSAQQQRQRAELQARSLTVAAEAASKASTAHEVAIQSLWVLQERLAELESRVSERVERVAAWTRLVQTGAATMLDSLAAEASLAEAKAALNRAKASFFLTVVSAAADAGMTLTDMGRAWQAD
jgi:hypothetical protein